MPQLELMSWLFNFTLGWITFIIVFSLMIKKKMQFPTTQTANTSQKTTLKKKWLWN